MWTIGEGATLAKLENGRKDTSFAQPFSASPNFNWDGDDDEAHHVDHHFPKSLLLFPRQVNEDITFWVLKQLEGDGQVMVLQHGLVVVHQSQLRAWHKENQCCLYWAGVSFPNPLARASALGKLGWR